MSSPTEIAKEIERLADKYRAKKEFDKRQSIIEDDSFNESYLNDLESEFAEDDDSEIAISDFIHPKNEVKKDFGYSFEKEIKPKEEVLELVRDISKNLRDLKVLIRS